MTNCKKRGFSQSDYSAASTPRPARHGTAQTPGSAAEEPQRPVLCFHTAAHHLRTTLCRFLVPRIHKAEKCRYGAGLS